MSHHSPSRTVLTSSVRSGGQAQPQQTQSTNQVPAVQINFDNLRPRTRFDDLAQPVQDQIALIDKGIARVIKMKDEIGEFMPVHEKDIEQLGRDVKFVESKFRGVQVALNRDIQTVKVLQDMTKKNIADAQLSFKATDNLKLPTHYHQTGLFATPTAASSNTAAAAAGGGATTDASATHADAQDLITYFNRICDDLEKYKRRLDDYRGEIERDMPGVENGLYEQIRALREHHNSAIGGENGGSMQDQLGQVLLALRETGTAIVNQAGQIADTRERLSRLQAGILDSGVYALGMGA
jgi:nucleoporin p58/p45